MDAPGLISDLQRNNAGSHWYKPITGGVLTALIVGLLLDLLGMGLGFSLFSPSGGVVHLLSLGTLVWLFLVGISSMYAGGWMAGYFSEETSSETGVFYGLMVSFSVILILLALTLTAFGIIVSGSLNGLQRAVPFLYSTITEGTSTLNKLSKEISKISPELSEKFKKSLPPDLRSVINEIDEQAAELLPSQSKPHENGIEETTSEKPFEGKTFEKEKARVKKLIAHYLSSIGHSENEEAKKELIRSLSDMSGKPQTEISQKVDKWQKLYLDAKEKIRQTAIDWSKDVAKIIGKLAILNFFILLSGIAAAVVGGIHGTSKRRNLVISL